MTSFISPPVTAVTQGPAHHWAGYYDLCPWDATGRYLLVAEADFQDREPAPGECCRLGVIDCRRKGAFEAFAETTAWNWPLGARLQWRGPRCQDEVVYNTCEAGRFISVLHDLKRGTRRILPSPVYSLTADGQTALTMNFARVAACRPGTGYHALPDPYAAELAPEADGIIRLDLETGATTLLVSLADLTEHEPHRTMAGARHWVSHPRFCPDASRFAFLHRWCDATGRFRWHRLLTARPDGSDLGVVCDYQMVSHFDWYDNERILVWARQLDLGDHFYLFHVTSGKREVVGFSTLTQDGHCSFSPDRRWLVTDTYPDEHNEQELLLYQPATDLVLTAGRFYADPHINGEFRCDLNPRWSRDGKSLCFDSIHEGSRQVYVVEVSRIVSR